MKGKLPKPTKAAKFGLGRSMPLDLGPRVVMGEGRRKLDLTAPNVSAIRPPVAVPPASTTNEKAHEETAKQLKSAFMQRHEAEVARYTAVGDSEFWLCVCFISRDQKEAFIAGVSWPGVDLDTKYADGVRLAAALDIELPPTSINPPGEKPNKSVVALGIIGDEGS
jgi:hypothetical protein